MKKLMTVLVSAATLCALNAANGEGLTTTGFEYPGYTTNALDTAKDDAGLRSGESGFARVWNNERIDDGDSKIFEFDATGAEATPAKFSGDVGSQYLHVETGSNRVERYVQYGGGTTNIADGIYLDTLVKFTASEELFKAGDLDDGDKIAIAYVGQTEGDFINNIVVRAGYVDGSTIVQTNYIMNSETEINPDNWYRLTVRAIANTGSDVAPVGFAIYLDGELLVYDVGQKAGNEAYETAIAGNSTIATYLYNSGTHAFLPSLVDREYNTATTLSAVGFKGTGCIDNIAFSKTKPEGLPDEGKTVTIVWDSGVASVTVNNGDIAGFTTEGLEYTSTNLTVGADVTVLSVVASYNTGKEAGVWEVSEGTATDITGGKEWTFVDGATLTINSITPTFEVNGVNYGSFDAALAAAAGTDASTMGTIKLLRDVTGDNEVSGWVTIDLAGKTLTGVTDGAIINNNANLFITNTTEVIGHVEAGTAAQAVLLTGGDTTIYAGSFDGEVFVDGGDLSLYGGFYLDTNSATEVDDFYLKAYAKDTVYYTGSDYYFQVGGEEPEPPLTGWAAVLGKEVGGAYEIDNLTELKAFQANVGTLPTTNTTFKLTADIELDGAWEGIGIKGGKDLVNGSTKDIPTYEAGAFCGTFDGQNHTISNFQMEDGTDYGALFNSVNNATIKNLKISWGSSTLCANSSSSGDDTGATFVGVARGSTLQNLTAKAGSVTTVSASKDMAGIVGYLMAGSTVDSCTNELNVASLLTAKARKSGGIVLITQDGSGTATIRNCKNSGTVTLAKAGGQLGGIVGYVGTTTAIADCENTAAVKMVTHMSGTLTMSGVNKGNATVESCNKAIDGLNFATVDNGVATFVADNALALNGEYKVMATNVTATFAFAEAGTIAFDTALFTPTYAITAPGLTLTDSTSGTVKTYTAAAAVTPIEPGQSSKSYATEEAAKAAAAAVEVGVPTAVATALSTPEAQATYKAMFEPTVVSDGAGGYKVEVAMKEDVVEAIQTQADGDAAEVVEDLTEANVTLTTTPGLYYSFEYGTSLGNMTEGARTMATGSSLELARPTTVNATSGFYKVLVNITDK